MRSLDSLEHTFDWINRARSRCEQEPRLWSDLLELLGQPGERAGGGSHGSFFTQGSRDERKSVRHSSRASVPVCSPDLVRARLGTSVGAAFLLPSAYEGAWMRESMLLPSFYLNHLF